MDDTVLEVLLDNLIFWGAAAVCVYIAMGWLA